MVSWRPACSSSFPKYCVDEEIREEEEKKENAFVQAKTFIFLSTSCLREHASITHTQYFIAFATGKNTFHALTELYLGNLAPLAFF